ncbi:DUF305 domain-containing protein [Micromonospora sp. NPDC049559]|uniref:DUF305 domain-containing protein n=1 Tax=Micromonospora sp. NPDC049559 TaxID=3155923 RepID=UPI003435C397
MREARIIVVLLVALAVSGCGGGSGAPRGEAASAGAGPVSSVPATAATPAEYAPAGGFNTTDVAWLQLMRPMTEQNLRLLELVSDRTADPRLTRLAREAVRDGDAHLARLRTLLDRARAGGANPHEGHDMPGLPTTEELAGIAGTRGAEFDRRFTATFREYAEQCARLAGSERTAGADAETTALAEAIERSATGQLAALRQLA